MSVSVVYVVVKVRRSSESHGFLAFYVLSVREFNPFNVFIYGLLSVSSFLHILDMFYFVHLRRSFA